jgi:uncharacterized protein YbjT (DUF2867 family)
VRNAAKAAALRRGAVTPVDFDFDRPATHAAALEGVRHVFLLPPMSPDPVAQGNAFVDAARQAGVEHIVKLSSFGCEMEPGIQLGRWHRAVEKHIEATGIGFTFLRPNNFMSNFHLFAMPQPDGSIFMPLGNGAVSYVDPRDIAEVAARTLMDAGHMGKAYTLTGPEALTVAQVAGQIAEVAKRSIKYVDVPETAARKAMLDAHMPAWMVDAMMELHAIDKAGHASAIAPGVRDVLGRPARRFADYSREHAALWAKRSGS